MVLALLGNLAISYLAIRAGVSVREALTQAARRAPILLGAALLAGCAAVAFIILVTIVLGIVFAGAAMSSGGTPTPEQLASLSLSLVLVVLPVAIYFAARLAMMTPAAAAERGGPFSLISRSWALTKGHALKLIALIIILVGVLVRPADRGGKPVRHRLRGGRRPARARKRRRDRDAAGAGRAQYGGRGLRREF